MAQIIIYTLLAYHPAYCTHRTKDITEFSPKLRLMTPPWQLWSATGNVDADKVRIAEAVHIWIAHPCKRPVPSIMSTFKMGMVLKRKELSLYLKASQPTAYFNSISPKKVFGGPFVFWEHVLWPWLSLHPDFFNMIILKHLIFMIAFKIHISTNPTLTPWGSLQPHMADSWSPKGFKYHLKVDPRETADQVEHKMPSQTTNPFSFPWRIAWMASLSDVTRRCGIRSRGSKWILRTSLDPQKSNTSIWESFFGIFRSWTQSNLNYFLRWLFFGVWS